MTKRKHISLNKETFDELNELKRDGITWDVLLKTLARRNKNNYEIL